MKRMLFALLAAAALAGLLSACAAKQETTESSASAETPPAAETAAPDASVLKIYCFQAGKADAFLFWNDAGAVLIDTGESGFGKTILAKLEELGIRRLDCLIITHFDKDHVGGAKKLLAEIPVGTVLQSNCPKPGADAYDKYAMALAELGIEAVTVRRETSFSLGDVTFAVDPPAQDAYPNDESNNSSLIVTVTHGENRLLFCGDAENLRLAEFLEQAPGPCVFVKLPHHGKYQKTLKTLLDLTAPTWALITSSDEEPEEEKTLALLAESGVQTLLTRESAFLLTSDGKALAVQPAP